LHELVHIVRGPHDAAFYRLLDELQGCFPFIITTDYYNDCYPCYPYYSYTVTTTAVAGTSAATTTSTTTSSTISVATPMMAINLLLCD
jgi:hypothetical protein